MKIAVAGGSGFIGNAITEELLAQNHSVYILTRDATNKINSSNITYVQWLNDQDQPEQLLQDTDVFINLAGESLNSGRWTVERKKLIIQSRLTAAKEINRIISALHKPPNLLLSASAIGYYGTSLTETFTENNDKQPSDFLSKTVDLWEKEATKVKVFGVRTVLIRFGVILGENGGALPRMLLPYKLFIGGTIGRGDQWVSWMHIRDLAKATLFCIHSPKIHGPVNFTAPNPKTMKEFGKSISQTLKKPHWLPVPPFALKIALGEMSILVLDGQKVLPQQLLQQGFNLTSLF